MICPKCGTSNNDNATYCGVCGFKLTKTDLTRDAQSIQTMSSPPGFQAGVFPREHLISGETLHWEGRPALVAYLGGGVVLLILATLFLIPDSSVLRLFGLLLFLIAVIKLVVGFFSWKNAAFAITDKRVMARYGVFTKKYAECYHDRIQNTTVTLPFFQRILGYGIVLFATSGFMGGTNTRSADKMQASGGAIVWNGVRNPNEVKRYAVDIIEQSRTIAKRKEYEMMANVLRDSKIAEAKMVSHASEPQQAAPAQPGRTMEERLKEAKRMRESELISQDEYEDMRKKILAEG